MKKTTDFTNYTDVWNLDLAAKAADYYGGVCEIRNEVAKSIILDFSKSLNLYNL